MSLLHSLLLPEDYAGHGAKWPDGGSLSDTYCPATNFTGSLICNAAGGVSALFRPSLGPNTKMVVVDNTGTVGTADIVAVDWVVAAAAATSRDHPAAATINGNFSQVRCTGMCVEFSVQQSATTMTGQVYQANLPAQLSNSTYSTANMPTSLATLTSYANTLTTPATVMLGTSICTVLRPSSANAYRYRFIYAWGAGGATPYPTDSEDAGFETLLIAFRGLVASTVITYTVHVNFEAVCTPLSNQNLYYGTPAAAANSKYLDDALNACRTLQQAMPRQMGMVAGGLGFPRHAGTAVIAQGRRRPGKKAAPGAKRRPAKPQRKPKPVGRKRKTKRGQR